jgi:hypothetical protein
MILIYLQISFSGGQIQHKRYLIFSLQTDDLVKSGHILSKQDFHQIQINIRS